MQTNSSQTPTQFPTLEATKIQLPVGSLSNLTIQELYNPYTCTSCQIFKITYRLVHAWWVLCCLKYSGHCASSCNKYQFPQANIQFQFGAVFQIKVNCITMQAQFFSSSITYILVLSIDTQKRIMIYWYFYILSWYVSIRTTFPYRVM